MKLACSGLGVPALGRIERALLTGSLFGRFSGWRGPWQLPAFEKAVAPGAAGPPLGVRFVNIAKAAGLTHKTIFGGEARNTYLLETTGCGAAFFDYDNDGWLDIFCVNGSRLEGFPKGREPVNHLYKNNRNGTFTDVTERAGLAHSGWGQGVCVGDYDNDGFEDLFVTHWGKNVLYHNNGDGTFTDVSEKAGVAGARTRWGTGCAFLDYDRDGRLDLFVANYIDLDLKSAPLPETGPCLYKGVTVACGPPGLPGGKNILYHNDGDGTFTDVSGKAGITRANGTYGLGVLTADFDNDGWPDIYVANDSQPSALYHNNHDGTFTDIGITAGCAYSQDGKPQAGMGATAGDYDCDGWLDIFKTNFSEDTASLYRNIGHNTGDTVFDDVTFAAGLGLNTRYLSWGCGFFDLDNDGWPDIFVASGHIYPEIKKLNLDIRYQEPKTVYRNLGNGRFQEVSQELGAAVLEPVSGRGCAFGDFDNDGDIDVLINPVNDYPELLRSDSTTGNHWLKVRTIGTKSNRSGIGARVKCVTGSHQQIDEVRSGGSWASQNDLRVHFGLGKATKADRIEVRWPSGHVDALENIAADQVVYVEEGKGAVKGK
ncbi:MAG: RNA-binding protein [Acidobacteria bacterium]|nr:MAG: RNA-binding protein [Acidobacteriota bacterium]